MIRVFCVVDFALTRTADLATWAYYRVHGIRQPIRTHH